MTTHLTELDWARLLGGELGWWAGRHQRRHLRGCATCRQQEEALLAERRAFQAAPARAAELGRLGASLPPPASRPTQRPASRLAWGGAAALALGLAVLAVLPGAPPGDALAAKGGATFTVLVERPGGSDPLGARCAPGDRLMATWRTPLPHLLVLERDGQGRVQALFPREGAASARLSAPEGATPGSWILDDAPGRECFIAFFSEAPIATAAAAGALAAAPERPALAGVTAVARCCDKAARR